MENRSTRQAQDSVHPQWPMLLMHNSLPAALRGCLRLCRVGVGFSSRLAGWQEDGPVPGDQDGQPPLRILNQLRQSCSESPFVVHGSGMVRFWRVPASCVHYLFFRLGGLRSAAALPPVHTWFLPALLLVSLSLSTSYRPPPVSSSSFHLRSS